jgi:GTPase SAR1 family protein
MTESLNPDAGKNSDPATLINSSWNQLVALNGQIDERSTIQASVDRMNLGTFRLVVMGEIKKGKSSFINALLGEADLLPTDSDVATSTVYKVIWGPVSKYKVFFVEEPGAEISPPLEISRIDIAEYGTEKGNPSNQKNVDFIAIEVPNSLLKDGLVIIDTPGVGGLFKAHKEITWNYAPNADAIIFVLDSVESVIGQDEVEFLQELVQDITQRVFFVQTKIDIPDKAQAEQWVQRNQEVLKEHLPTIADNLIYMPISSKIKQIADERKSGRHLNQSGFVDVIGFLENRLKPAKIGQVAQDSARLMIGGVNDKCRELVNRQKMLSAETKEEWDKLQQEYLSTQATYRDWKSTQFDTLRVELLEAFDNASRQLKKELDLRLDPQGEIVVNVIQQLREVPNLSPKEIPGQFPECRQTVLHQCQLVVNAAINAFTESTLKTTEKTFGELLQNTVLQDQDELDAVFGDRDEVLSELSGQSIATFESTHSGVRSSFIAVATGYGLLNIVASVAGVGVILLPVSVFVAAGFAAFAVWKVGENQGKEQAYTKIASELRSVVQQAHRHAVVEVTDKLTEYRNLVIQRFVDIADRRTEELQDRVRDLDAIKEQGVETSRQQLLELAAEVKQYSNIRTNLMAVLK